MQREGAFPPAAAQTSVVTDLPDHARAGDLNEGTIAGGDEFRGSVGLTEIPHRAVIHDVRSSGG
jgi:hypothetical protein